MGRDKLQRQLQFKPRCRHFSAKECNEGDTIHLLHEELEALYLMDSRGLYQADAAEQMGVSRPTFARILKNAREKVTMMLVTGADFLIDDEKDDLVVLVASMKNSALQIGTPSAPFLILYHLHQHTIVQSEVFENPVFVKELRPGQVLPEFCTKHKVNYFVSETIGSGLKDALLSKGIYSISRKEFSEEDLCTLES